MEIRPVEGAAEREICVDTFMRSMNDLRVRRGHEAADAADMGWLSSSIDHFAQTDPADLVLAFDRAEPVAFGCAIRRESFWFLSYLFVLPASQGAGVGRAILERLLPVERASWDLATVVEASQPVSAMLYATAGMAPRVPLYWLDGVPRLDGLPELPDGVTMEPLSLDRHGEEVDGFDRMLLGYARPVDHAMWLRDARAARAYRAADGSLVGYGYRAPDEWISPVGAADEALTAAIVRDLADPGLGEGDGEDAGKITVQVAGSAGTLIPLLLRAGLRSEEGAHMLYCSNGRVPPPSYLMYGGFLP